MDQAEQQLYWKRTRLMAWIILAGVAVFGLVVAIFIGDFDQISFLDFPLGFFLAAQGILALMVAASFWYSFLQRRVDREFGFLDDD